MNLKLIALLFLIPFSTAFVSNGGDYSAISNVGSLALSSNGGSYSSSAGIPGFIPPTQEQGAGGANGIYYGGNNSSLSIVGIANTTKTYLASNPLTAFWVITLPSILNRQASFGGILLQIGGMPVSFGLIFAVIITYLVYRWWKNR